MKKLHCTGLRHNHALYCCSRLRLYGNVQEKAATTAVTATAATVTVTAALERNHCACAARAASRLEN